MTTVEGRRDHSVNQSDLRLLHHGQLGGSQVHLPVFLGRYPDEPIDAALEAFYQAFLIVLADPSLQRGEWRLCDRTGWPGDDRFRALLSWCWTGDSRWLVVVNLSDSTAAGLVHTAWEDLRGQAWKLVDPTQHVHFVRSGDDLVDGMFVELPAWGWHLLRIEPPADPAVVQPMRNRV